MIKTADATPAISCEDLTKIYTNGVVALDSLTLTIERGMSFGLLGENGAGKSTLVRLVMGFISPTSGQVSVLGETKVRLAHTRLGYLHERPYVELRFNARHYLKYLGELSGLWGKLNEQRVAHVLEQVDLVPAAGERLATYSKGMLQRLSIAQALLTDPELLILDEPTNGLDPYSQWQVRQIIAALRQEGKTILICSHYLAEVEMLCNTVGILHRGRLVQHGAVSDLLYAQDRVEIILAGEQRASDIVAQLGIAEHVIEMQDNKLQIPASVQTDILSALVSANVAIHSLNPLNQTLEEVYISSTHPENEALADEAISASA